MNRPLFSPPTRGASAVLAACVAGSLAWPARAEPPPADGPESVSSAASVDANGRAEASPTGSTRDDELAATGEPAVVEPPAGAAESAEPAPVPAEASSSTDVQDLTQEVEVPHETARADAEGDASEALDEPGPAVVAAPSRGGLEFGLGSTLALASVGMIAVGAVQISRGLTRREACVDAELLDEPDCFLVDPPTGRFVAAGVAWAFAIPLAVGAGIWLRRGVAVRRAARSKGSAVVVVPDLGVGRAGVGVVGRF